MKITQTLIILIAFSITILSGKSSIKDKISAMLPKQVEVLKVEKKHFNLYTAFLASGDLIYVDLDKSLLFYGGLLSYDKKSDQLVNLSDEDTRYWREELRKQTIKNVNIGELKKIAVLDKVNGGNIKRQIIMFDSLTCPYCKKVNDFFEEGKHKLHIWRIYNDTHLTEGELTRKYKVKNATSRIEKMEAMYKKYKVRGTPYIYTLEKGKVTGIIEGADMPKIKEWIKK